jgi:serine phosphatase RsbU (regulator of sigma subunit)
VTGLRVPKGSVLALYTDGVVEQPESDIDLGIERLRIALSHAGAAPLQDTAERLVQEAGQRHARPDDIALLLAARPAHG